MWVTLNQPTCSIRQVPHRWTLTNFVPNALKNGDGVAGVAVIVAAKFDVGVRAQDHDVLENGFVEGQNVVVFEKDDRLTGKGASKREMLGAFDFCHGSVRPRDAFGRIEEAEAEANGEHAMKRGINFLFRDEALCD